MDVNRILSEIDTEISRLQSIRSALSGLGQNETIAAKGRRGRPKGSTNVTSKATAAKSAGKRKLTPEGRKSISDAMKRRWAERRKQASK